MKNILFIVVDCLGHKFLTGEKRQNYPYLNYLFSEGTYFSQAISVASTTSPSIASMLTGCYPFRHGIMTLSGNRLSHKVPFLPEILKDIGYNTYAEVTGPLWQELGLSRGFDYYICRDKKSYLHSEWGRKLENKFFLRYFKEPWFLFLHIFELHQPRQILPEYNYNLYRTPYEKALRSLDHTLGEIFHDVLDLSKTIVILTGDHGEQVEKNNFDKMFRAQIKKLYDSLYRFGLFKEYWLTLYRKLLIGHGFDINETLVRVPLLFVDQERLPKDIELNFQVSLVDILPTLLSLLGSKETLEIDGEQILFDKDIGTVNSEHVAYMQASGIVLPDPSRCIEGIRYRGMKYIKYMHGLSNCKEWLYNIKDDHKEKTPINDKEKLKMMRMKLETIKTPFEKTDEALTMSQKEIIEVSKRLKDLGYM